jgi:pyrroloquinoline-quinone synthase
MDLRRFDDVTLIPAARAYRDLLDQVTQKRGWAVAAAVVTLFVEGTKFERGEVDATAAKRPMPPLSEHPLVKHYGLPLEHLALTKAHRQVEGNHRASAWKIILEHVPESDREAVIVAMEEALTAWLRYRDAVAAACGIGA